MKPSDFYKIILWGGMLILPALASAQAKKPTVMVIPAETWCMENGYTDTYELQGKTVRVPDYERSVQESMELMAVTTKIGSLMSDRGFPLKDLAATIKSINQNSVEDEMTLSSTSGASLAETPLDRLLNRAKADIVVEVAWKVNHLGPKNSVTYILRGIDAYTNKQIAGAEGTGPQSFTSETAVLLEEAVLQHMDAFAAQLQDHFADLLANGREIAFNVRVFDNGSGLSMEDAYGAEELTDVIDNWVAENTVNHRYSLSDAAETRLSFEQVRIPLYRPNGRPMDTRQWVSQLRRYLASQPYGITSKVVTKGLGRADLILGEK